MAFHSKKEFATLCGIGSNALAVYVKRGKVILSGDYIDDKIPENREFFEKRQEKQKEEEAQKEPVKVENTKSPNIKAPEPKKRKAPIISPPEKNYQSIDSRIKEIELKKKTEETAILKLKKEKMEGEVIPTDIVKTAFQQHFKSINTSYQNATENIIISIGKKKDLNRAEIADIRKELTDIINSAVKEAVKESTKHISRIVNEYAQVRGVGERK